MSDLSERLAGRATNADDKGSPVSEFDGETGFVQSRATPADEAPDFDNILREFGYDLEKVQIVGAVRTSRWQAFDGRWLCSYRFNIESRTVFELDLPALYAEVARTPRTAPRHAGSGATAVVCWADVQTGKALADETPILTADGWKTHGDVRPGDYVYAPDGELKRVLGVTGSSVQDLYRVVFDRGVSILATGDHLWSGYRKYRVGDKRVGSRTDGTRRHGGGGRYEDRELTWTTKQIAALPTRRSAGGNVHTPRSFSIDLTEPLEAPERELPIDPYLLGVWLGDGSSSGAYITVGREDEEWLKQFGHCCEANTDSTHYGVYVPGLRSALRENGLLGNKHVPDEYLAASPKQRLELLRGLMDTDGSCDTRGICEFSNTNMQIVDSVCYLLSSLGFKFTRTEHVGMLNGEAHKPYSRVAIPSRADLSLFNLKRKSDRETWDYKERTRRRQVQYVEPAGRGMAQCLKVEGGLYLAGRELVVTHNCDHLGGLKELLERLDEKRAALDEYLVRGGFDHVVIADCGDIIEGFQNFDAQTRTNALSIMDQVDVAATELWKAIRTCANRAPVDVLSIPSNHCRWAKGKSLVGKVTDDWGLHVSKRLERMNDEVGLPVAFHRAEEWMETLEFDVRGTRLGLAHGHQANNPDQIKNWWAKMAHGGVLSCDVLVTGHFHFPSLRPSGKNFSGRSKWHIQASTLDNGSAWVRNKMGEDGDPALTVFSITDDGFNPAGYALL